MKTKNHKTTNPHSNKLCGDCEAQGFCKMYDLNKYLMKDGTYHHIDSDNPVELFKVYNKRMKELMNYMPSLYFTFQDILPDGERKAAYNNGQAAYGKQDYLTAETYFTSPAVNEEDDFGTVAQFFAAICNYYSGNYKDAISFMTLFNNNVMFEFSKVANEFIHICTKIIEENEAAIPVLQKHIEQIAKVDEPSQKVKEGKPIFIGH